MVERRAKEGGQCFVTIQQAESHTFTCVGAHQSMENTDPPPLTVAGAMFMASGHGNDVYVYVGPADGELRFQTFTYKPDESALQLLYVCTVTPDMDEAGVKRVMKAGLVELDRKQSGAAGR